MHQASLRVISHEATRKHTYVTGETGQTVQVKAVGTIEIEGEHFPCSLHYECAPGTAVAGIVGDEAYNLLWMTLERVEPQILAL